MNTSKSKRAKSTKISYDDVSQTKDSHDESADAEIGSTSKRAKHSVKKKQPEDSDIRLVEIISTCKES
jgi:hypothetical protein